MLFDCIRRNVAAGPADPKAASLLHILGIALAILPAAAAAHASDPLVSLARPLSIPQDLRQARPLGRLSADTKLGITLTLPWRNAADLAMFNKRLSTPGDPFYKKFLTHQQFVDRYAPTVSDYQSLTDWARASGLLITRTSSARNLLEVSGPRDTVEAALHTHFNRFQLASGRVVYINDVAPSVPQSVAARITGVLGLTNYALRRPLYKRKLSDELASFGLPQFVGSGVDGGVTPADIKNLYNFAAISGLNGAGETVALYEQNGFLASDIDTYVTTFKLPVPAGATVPDVEVVPLDGSGYTGTVTDPDTQGEVTLDIELVLALAPEAKILVYEFDDESVAALTTDDDFALLNQIIQDDAASVISESYGLSEQNASLNGDLQAENGVLAQAVSQGQGFFASAGDTGAYNDVYDSATAAEVEEISVSDPASQPDAVAVGGTSLLGAGPGYAGETTWNDGSVALGAGGGGSSVYWQKPDYQTGEGVSATMRDLPDVSLDADPETGYSVYLTGAFTVFGGTSCSSPLWAGFDALVNQQRVAYGLSRMGFANPNIYAVAEGANYAKDFHDINDASSNLAYLATSGFDDATGWGTFQASNLLADFAPTTFGSGVITATVTNGSGTPVSGANVAVTTGQIPGFTVNATTNASGVATFTLATGIHDFNGTTLDATLAYTVAASETGEAGSSMGNVLPPASVPLIVEPTQHAYPSGGLQMISSPYDFSIIGDFATLFGLSLPLSSSGAALYAWSPSTTAYLSYPTAPADTLRLGNGYFATLPTSAYLRRIGTGAPDQAFRINLLPGWNMIGDPFTSAVPVSNIQVDTVAGGSPVPIGSSASVQLPLYYFAGVYNGSGYSTLTTGGSLQPYQGYWIHATTAMTLVVPVP